MFNRGDGREVRYPEQVRPAYRFRQPLPSGAEEMIVHDSIYEQLAHYARHKSLDQQRRRRIFKFRGRALDYVMMRTVELPDYDWPAQEND